MLLTWLTALDGFTNFMPAYPRIRRISPSQKMTALSNKFSVTNLHDDLPFKSPVDLTEPLTLSQASCLDDKFAMSDLCSAKLEPGRRKLSRAQSKESRSTYSSFGDPLSDEIGEETITLGSTNRSHMNDVQRTAALIAARTGTNTESLIPKLLSLCGNQHDQGPGDSSNDATDGKTINVLPNVSVPIKHVHGQKHKPKPLRLHKTRRFSFELGDDNTFDLPWPAAQNSLRRSMSLNQLPHHYHDIRSNKQTRNLTSPRTDMTSPALLSPSLSTATVSKIPSPVFDSTLARPRRDGSVSSLMTTVKHSDFDVEHSERGSVRSISRRSNINPAIHNSGMNSPDVMSKRSLREKMSSKKLVEQNNSLRGNHVAIAAARAASMSSLGARNPVGDVRSSRHSKQMNKQESASVGFRPSGIAGDHRRTKENTNPTTQLPAMGEKPRE